MNRLFSVPFPFIVRAHVKVFLAYDVAAGTGTELTEGLGGFSWISDTQIQTTTAPPVGETLTVIRRTPSGAQLVVWAPGSPPTQNDLNTADLQALYVIQEQADLTAAAVTTALTAAAAANAAVAAVAAALPYQPIAAVANIPASPTNGQRIEIINTTGLATFTPLAGKPLGFLGGTDVKARLVYGTPVLASWNWVDYFPIDPDGRYAGINFTQSGTGATPRALATKLRDGLISVKDFGALGNGITDDTAAFNAAIASTSETQVGILIPKGNYRLATSPVAGGKTITWFIDKGVTTTNGAGNVGATLPGAMVSNGIVWPQWVGGTAAKYNGPWSYYVSTSAELICPADSRLAYSALCNPTTPLGGANIGFAAGALNQTSGTGQGSTWNFYGSSVADSSSPNATTQCIELDITALAGSQDKTYGIVIAAGGEIAEHYNPSISFKSVGSAVQISNNSDPAFSNCDFLNGIVIQKNAISPSLNNAVYMASGHAIRWFNTGNSFCAQVSASTTTAAQATWIDISSNGTLFQTLGGSGLFQVDNSPTTGATNNFLAVSPGIASGDAPRMSAKGADANVDLALQPKGAGFVSILSGGLSLPQNSPVRWLNGSTLLGSIASNQFGTQILNPASQILFQVSSAYSSTSANWLTVDSAVAGGAPKIWCQGSNANIDLALEPKGTGVLNISSSGVSGSVGSLFGYLSVKVNGTPFKIPLYNP